ncbi:MAG: alpha/beta fold hydrolase [Acidobacteria bacterium]|nr:alpha/beta fold hydrolase [Acidobacteriota bacterium]
MPVVELSAYRSPLLLRHSHLLTVIPSLFRKVTGVSYVRQRLELSDGDFVDLDWSRTGAERLVLLCHGLESSARSEYIRGMVRALNRRRWDCLALNFRGCSGVPNRLLRTYHSGDTADVAAVIRHIIAHCPHRELALVGFSLGGNVVLKYLGEGERNVPAMLTTAAAVSAPVDLAGSAERLARPGNRLYMRRFLRKLRRKLEEKRALFPDDIHLDDYDRMTTFREFDDRYTAPFHGFTDAADYWARSSSRQFLPGIRRPTLLLNAADDPFLSPSCFPRAEAEGNPRFFLEIPSRGGHVGFVRFFDPQREYYHEERVAVFLEEHSRLKPPDG